MNLLNNVNLICLSLDTFIFILRKYRSTFINYQYMQKSNINFTVEFKPSRILRGKLKSGVYDVNTYPKITAFNTRNK